MDERYDHIQKATSELIKALENAPFEDRGVGQALERLYEPLKEFLRLMAHVPYVTMFSRAPQRYDHGSTLELEVTPYFRKERPASDLPYRMLAIPKKDMEAQIQRNLSGLYETWTMSEMEDSLRQGYVTTLKEKADAGAL